jgi:hypothetical protein
MVKLQVNVYYKQFAQQSQTLKPLTKQKKKKKKRKKCSCQTEEGEDKMEVVEKILNNSE